MLAHETVPALVFDTFGCPTTPPFDAPVIVALGSPVVMGWPLGARPGPPAVSVAEMFFRSQAMSAKSAMLLGIEMVHVKSPLALTVPGDTSFLTGSGQSMPPGEAVALPSMWPTRIWAPTIWGAWSSTVILTMSAAADAVVPLGSSTLGLVSLPMACSGVATWTSRTPG